MRKAIVAGILVFLILVLIRIPAGIIHTFVPDGSQIRVLSPEGTLWNGSGELLVQGISTGIVNWSVQPSTILQGRLGYELALSGAGIDIDASLETGLATTKASINGTVEGAFVNRWLAPYHIELDGVFHLADVKLILEERLLTGLDGRLSWDGGPIRYRLSGIMHDSALPPMLADLGPGPAAVAYARGESTPLLQAALGDNGFARIGVTKYLTRILGQPWPGSDPDHAVVLEVEEQVF